MATPRSEPGLKRARKFQTKPARPPLAPRVIRYVVVALGFVLIVDALFGEGGLFATMRARHDYDALKTYVARLQDENAQLREQARQLREDPQAIEAIARQELGLIYPGETLFIVKDHSRRPIP